MPLIQLVYLSSATRDLTEAELHDLLEHTRRSNAARGITGVLLYKDRSFIVTVA